MIEAPAKHPVKAYKRGLTIRCREVIRWPLQGPVSAAIVFVLPRPQSKWWKTRPNLPEWREEKPDIDNLVKAVLDALDGIAWSNDSQVAELWSQKRIAGGDENACTLVRIVRLGPIDLISDRISSLPGFASSEIALGA